MFMQNGLSRRSTQQALRKLIMAHKLPEEMMPTNKQLGQAGELQLIYSIVRLGGFNKIAASTQAQYSTAASFMLSLNHAAEGLQQFAKEHPAASCKARNVFVDFWHAGRFYLTMDYRQFG